MSIAECVKHWPLKIVHRWQRMPEWNEFIINGRKGHTVVPYKDAIYVFGGDNGETMFNDLLRFDVKIKVWEKAFEIGTLPAPRTHHSAVVYNSSMFVFGGCSKLDPDDEDSLNDLFEYNFKTDQWKEWDVGMCKPLPRSTHGAVVYDKKLWIFGGCNSRRICDMWTISLNESIKEDGKQSSQLGEIPREWKQVNQMGEIPRELSKFSVVVTRDSMFAFGGVNFLQPVNNLYQFHFTESRWTHISTEHMVPQARYGHTMVSFERRLYVFGGAELNRYNDLQYYDLDTQTWHNIVPSPKSQIPSCRVFHAATVIGDAMFVFGGKVDSDVCSAEMYRFQFAPYSECTLHDDFGRLLRNHISCDVEFIAGPKETRMPAHAIIIEARSEFLEAHIRQAREKRDLYLMKVHGTVSVPVKDMPLLEVTLKDTAPESFALVLKYIYTDRIDPTEILIDETEDLQSIRIIRHMIGVYHVAKEFNLKGLSQLCVNYFEDSITHSNVLEVLRTANERNLYLLKAICLSVAVKGGTYNVIVMSQEFQTLDQALIVEIERCRLMFENNSSCFLKYLSDRRMID